MTAGSAERLRAALFVASILAAAVLAASLTARYSRGVWVAVMLLVGVAILGAVARWRRLV
jgi:general stress protein CsbA